MDSISSCRYWILIGGVVIASNTRVSIYNVYVSHQPSIKLEIWNFLSESIVYEQNRCIYLIWDFNCVRNTEVKKNFQYRAYDSQAFNNFIIDVELMDVKA